jgi:hypothetical protein
LQANLQRGAGHRAANQLLRRTRRAWSEGTS